MKHMLPLHNVVGLNGVQGLSKTKKAKRLSAWHHYYHYYWLKLLSDCRLANFLKNDKKEEKTLAPEKYLT